MIVQPMTSNDLGHSKWELQLAETKGVTILWNVASELHMLEWSR
jgi:hypothetical protein